MQADLKVRLYVTPAFVAADLQVRRRRSVV
jgi:hypothetical protein